jgi:hypothetical protein
MVRGKAVVEGTKEGVRHKKIVAPAFIKIISSAVLFPHLSLYTYK